jgi:hypothetical protein
LPEAPLSEPAPPGDPYAVFGWPSAVDCGMVEATTAQECERPHTPAQLWVAPVRFTG